MDALLLLLPAVCDRNDAATHWWRLSAEGLIEQGCNGDWTVLAAQGGIPLICLAPAAAVRLVFPDPAGTTPRQQLGIARAQALASSFADAATVHAVAGMVDARPAVAMVANGQMVDWLDWLAAHGADATSIVPVGLVVPRSEHWIAAEVGAEKILARSDLVLPDEPALRDQLVEGAEADHLASEQVAAELTRLANERPLDLRSGRFARRRLLLLDRARLRELVVLAAIVPLLGLVMALVMIVRLERSSDRLEAETAKLASTALGQEVTAAAAQTALDTRIGSVPGASGSPFLPLTAVLSQVQQQPGMTATALAWRADGTLSIGLAATRAEDVNRLLAGLQRSGFRVTATSRAGPTGQVLADLTVRSYE